MSALFQSGYLPIVSFRSVPDYAFGKIRFWSLESRHRGVVVFCQRSGLLFQLLDASQSYSGEEVEDLTAKVFGGDFDLFQRILFRGTGRSLKSVNPYFKPKGPY